MTSDIAGTPVPKPGTPVPKPGGHMTPKPGPPGSPLPKPGGHMAPKPGEHAMPNGGVPNGGMPSGGDPTVDRAVALLDTLTIRNASPDDNESSDEPSDRVNLDHDIEVVQQVQQMLHQRLSGIGA